MLVSIRYAAEPEHDAELDYVLENAVLSVRGDGRNHQIANEIVDALHLRISGP